MTDPKIEQQYKTCMRLQMGCFGTYIILELLHKLKWGMQISLQKHKGNRLVHWQLPMSTPLLLFFKLMLSVAAGTILLIPFV